MIADKIKEYLKQWKIPALDNDILKEMVHDIAEIFESDLAYLKSSEKEWYDKSIELEAENKSLKDKLDKDRITKILEGWRDYKLYDFSIESIAKEIIGGENDK